MEVNKQEEIFKRDLEKIQLRRKEIQQKFPELYKDCKISKVEHLFENHDFKPLLILLQKRSVELQNAIETYD